MRSVSGNTERRNALTTRSNLGAKSADLARRAPSSWTTTTLQRLFSVSSGDFLRPEQLTEDGFLVYGGNGIRGRFLDYNAQALTMIIGRYGALCGNVHIPNEKFWATEHAFRVRPIEEYENRFVAYYVESLELKEIASRSAQPGLNSRMVREQAISLPDLATQKAIADFLDRETARIDTLVEKKKSFADLIMEREEASFLRAVTGKMQNRDLISSGVEWIGEIPKGWLAPKFLHVARLESGHTPSRKIPEYWIPEECVIPWVSLADVWQLRSGETVYLNDTQDKVSEIGLANSSARVLPAGTVVLSRTASVGFPGILAQPMATTQDFVGWIPSSRVRAKFLYYVLRAMKPEFRRLMIGSTHKTIYMPDIRSFRTPLPPLAEQDEIIRRLDASINTYRKVHVRIVESIDRLTELRASLITAAVTGQIDPATYGRRGTIDRNLERIEAEMAQ